MTKMTKMTKRSQILATVACLLAGVMAAPAGAEEAANTKEIVALSDDFSDGDITTHPSWEAGDMNWFNPFYVEKIGKRHWAGSRRYGSMGTWFTAPDSHGWPVPLDVREGPLTISFLVLFRPGMYQDALSMQLAGPESAIGARYTANGQLIVTFRPLDPSKGKVWQKFARVDKITPGQPTRTKIVLGGPARFALWFDGKPAFQLPQSDYAKADLLLGRFDRIAFQGALRVAEANVVLLVPQLQDTKAYRWITDLQVRGHSVKATAEHQPPLAAAPKTAVIFQGLDSLGTHASAGLRKAGWSVRDVYDHLPLHNEAQRTFLEQMQIDALREHRWVVLLDIHARRLGRSGCLTLREYVRCGGSLLVLGGVSTLGRGNYFTSPLAECLPVTGKEAWTSLRRVADNPACTYAYDVTPKPGARQIESQPPVWEIAFGAGRVRVVPWATVGNPSRPFWRETSWLAALLK